MVASFKGKAGITGRLSPTVEYIARSAVRLRISECLFVCESGGEGKSAALDKEERVVCPLCWK